MDRDPFDLVGDVLDGQFRVDAFAGEGDLSVVYKGHHLGVDAPVAIKCLNLPETLDPALARPLVDGFREASRMHYRLARGNLHIAQTIASGSTLVPRSGAVVPYLVREWFEGESLASDLTRRRAERKTGRSVEESLALLESAFDGVAHAHGQGEMHLSINPSNLFLVGAKGPGVPGALKVLDFGVARTMNAFASGIPPKARPGAGLRLLFPAYAAPEQLDRMVGDLGAWTDVYALALVVMEMLSDRLVMAETETGAVVEHALDEQRRPTPQAHGLKLPSHIDRALARAVSLSPSRRQKNAAELWKDVKNTVRSVSRSMAAAVPAATVPAAATRPPPVAAPAPEPSHARPLGGFPSAVPAPLPSQVPGALPSRTPAPAPARSLSGMPTPLPPQAPSAVPSRAPAPMPARAPFPASLHVPPPSHMSNRIATPAPGRMRAATLVGLSPPVLPIPGAGENRAATPATPSVATKPMSFEPPARPQPAQPTPPAQPAEDAPLSWDLLDAPPADPPAPPLTAAAIDPPAAVAEAPLPPGVEAPAPLPARVDALGSTMVDTSGSYPRQPQPEASWALQPAPAQPQAQAHPQAPWAAPQSAPTPWAAPQSAPTPHWAPPPPTRPDALAATMAAPVAPAFEPSHPQTNGAAMLGPGGFPMDAAYASTAPPPGIDRPALRRLGGPLAAIVTPRSTPVLLFMAGAAFWAWAAGILIWLTVPPTHHPDDAAMASASPTTLPAPTSSDGEPPALAPAAPAASAAAAAVPVAVAAAPVAGPAFKPGLAIKALDAKWREVAKCRRGKVWGKAQTTVTFAGDGTVSHVEVGAPFTDTPTGDCVADTLGAVRVEPFSGKSADVGYRVYVAPR